MTSPRHGQSVEPSDPRNLAVTNDAASPPGTSRGSNRGHDLADGRERAGRGLLDARSRRRGELEAHGESHGLVVVEQQRGQVRVRVQARRACRSESSASSRAEVETMGDALAFGAIAGVGYLVSMTLNIAINPSFPRPFAYGLLNTPYFLAGSLISCAILELMG